ncbi:MAG: hypothetical protein JWM77_2854 [Rhodospirillales bacterium]|nr:hypothetical protein [Rhodospirillales bacterium]
MAAEADAPPAIASLWRLTFLLLAVFAALNLLHAALTPNLFPLALRVGAGEALRWPSLVRLFVVAIASLVCVWTVARARPVPSALSRWQSLARWAIALSLPVSVLIAGVVLRRFPNSADEYQMLFQVETFRQGLLWQAPPPLDDLFQYMHIINRDGKWVGHFPPGWPAAVLAWTSLGLPAWLAGPACGAAMLALLYVFARRVADPRLAAPIVACVAITPFFLFNAASYFNHVFAAATLLALWIGADRFIARPQLGNAAATGAALGGLAVTRYFSTLLAALSVAIALLPRLRLRHVAFGLAGVLAGLCFVAPLLLYNREITGSAFTTVSGWAWPKLTFGLWATTEFGFHSTPIDAIRALLKQIFELAEWTSPVVPLAYAAALGVLLRRRMLRAFDLLPLLFVIAFLFYPDVGGNRYGPRYYFDPFPFAVLAIARGGAALWPGASSRLRAVLLACVALHVTFALATLPFASIYLRRVVDERMAIYDLVDEQKITNAVVLVAAPTGHLRPMYEWDLTRNGTRIDPGAPVLYALERGADSASRLAALYPTRKILRWDGGTLRCVERCGAESGGQPAVQRPR